MEFSKVKLQMIKEKSYNYNSSKIKSALDIIEYINEIERLDLATEESTLLICLNSKNQIVAYNEIARGGIDSCNVDLKTIFKTVLMCNGSKFILAHNHPSGTAEVGKNDIGITQRIKNASMIMDIQFLDHLVIAGNDFVSCMCKN